MESQVLDSGKYLEDIKSARGRIKKNFTRDELFYYIYDRWPSLEELGAFSRAFDVLVLSGLIVPVRFGVYRFREVH